MAYRLFLSLTFLALTAGAANAGSRLPQSATDNRFSGHELAADAKVSLTQARAIALRSRPGEITDEELERERGGSGLRYSFDVRSAGVTYEVGVDAKTGAVLENSREGAHPD
jgi:uncharacterized membrane protein YkoI